MSVTPREDILMEVNNIKCSTCLNPVPQAPWYRECLQCRAVICQECEDKWVSTCIAKQPPRTPNCGVCRLPFGPKAEIISLRTFPPRTPSPRTPSPPPRTSVDGLECPGAPLKRKRADYEDNHHDEAELLQAWLDVAGTLADIPIVIEDDDEDNFLEHGTETEYSTETADDMTGDADYVPPGIFNEPEPYYEPQPFYTPEREPEPETDNRIYIGDIHNDVWHAHHFLTSTGVVGIFTRQCPPDRNDITRYSEYLAHHFGSYPPSILTQSAEFMEWCDTHVAPLDGEYLGGSQWYDSTV